MNEKVDAVVRAWVVPGPHPEYHLQQMLHLREHWPTLYRAIVDLVTEHGGAP